MRRELADFAHMKVLLPPPLILNGIIRLSLFYVLNYLHPIPRITHLSWVTPKLHKHTLTTPASGQQQHESQHIQPAVEN